MKIVSYNCNSVRNNFEIVKSLFPEANILMLQGLILEKSDLVVLNDLEYCGLPPLQQPAQLDS